MITKGFIYQVIAGQKLGVLSAVNPGNKPESAVVGIAVSENLEIVFDTVKASRKYLNILHNHEVALVVWYGEVTVQYDGIAAVLGDDSDADRLREIYYKVYPDGRERAATW